MFDAVPSSSSPCTRRHLLRAAGALAAGATLARASRSAEGLAAPQRSKPNAAEKRQPLMQIGVLLGTFARPTLEARLDAVTIATCPCCTPTGTMVRYYYTG